MECVLKQAIIQVRSEKDKSLLPTAEFLLIRGAFKDQTWGEKMRYRGSFLFFSQGEEYSLSSCSQLDRCAVKQ